LRNVRVYVVLSRSETQNRYREARREGFVNYMLPDYKKIHFICNYISSVMTVNVRKYGICHISVMTTAGDLILLKFLLMSLIMISHTGYWWEA
jgi:hypothetical protein